MLYALFVLSSIVVTALTVGVDVTHPPTAKAATATPLAFICHGHANTPHKVTDQHGTPYIGYDAYQDCSGDFGLQHVCVQLQEKDYYGHFYAVTTKYCGHGTTADHAYAGRSVSCLDAHEGVYRTRAWGYAAGVLSSSGTSSSKTMCSGLKQAGHRAQR